MKKLNLNLEVSLDDSGEVIDVKLLGVNKPKKTTPELPTDMEDVELTDSALIVSEECRQKLGLVAGEKLTIYFENNDDGDFTPFIVASKFYNNANGLLLKKNNSIAFRGQRRTVLANFGLKFSLGDESDNTPNAFHLIPIVKPVLPNVDEGEPFGPIQGIL